ncbi:copper amine oxidase N-terminal domain-containing protein [Ruminiclostridium papyrosolvens]|uniref:Copper amine oxidase n=1 Tax=Ruminiclostridium papyrosolvens C7 TaxID=1330534 RepID=U4R3F4_9FIRM|nr:copper amine oxidase N-terminal domain-containing protein [Ruminiclostridium papyrosolvens]EPR12156.1 copper amine oxidase [Ruminiclostridium papyrosolvens C7]
MKKIIAVLLCIMLLLNTGIVMAAQTSSVQEDKAAKIIIDGVPLKLSNVAIIKDKKLMLSTEVFTGLGVAKTGQVWDKSKTKLTLTKGKTKLVMQINSSTATLNGTKKTVSVKPFLYKSKAYFPVDFVADCFGRNINKDSQTNTYFLRDKSSFSKNKLLLDNVLKSMNSVSKLKVKENAELSLKGTGLDIKLTAPVSTLMDLKSKKAFSTINYKMNTNGEVTENNILIAMNDNKQYSQVDQGEWTHEDMSEKEFTDGFAFNSLVKYDNTILSALTSVNGKDKNEVILKGNVIIGSTLSDFLTSQELIKNQISSKYVELTINTSTNCISKIILKESGTTDIEGTKYNFSVTYQMNFSDINGNFEVEMPSDLNS